MTRKSATSSVLTGGLQGGIGGATAGAAFGGPIGAAVGGAGGLLLGGLGGYFADQADEEANANDPEVQAKKRMLAGQKMFSANLGRAFAGMKLNKAGGFGAPL